MTSEHPTFVQPAAPARTAREQGEPASFDRGLLTAHYGWVQAVARNLVHDRSSADDVTQETLLAALSSPPKQVADGLHLRAWLGRVAFNLSRLGARQGARRRAREERVARSEALPSVCESIEAEATVASLTHAVQSLPESCRSAIVMRYFEGLSTLEIARRTGTTEISVRKRLWRARHKLRTTLEREFGMGRRLGLFAPLAWLRGGWRAPGGGNTALRWAAGLAAAALVAVSMTPWMAPPPGSRGAELASFAGEAGWAAGVAPPAESAEEDGGRLARHSDDTARVLPVETTYPESSPPPEIDPLGGGEPKVAGCVLDLAGRPVAGFDLVDAEHRDAALTTTDPLGCFAFRAPALPLRLEARAPGWTTVLPARIDTARTARIGEEETGGLLLVVAPALDLAGRVVDAHGRGLGDARLEVDCDESAWAAFDRPVRLESPRLCSFACDESGAFARPEVPRAPGFWLRVTCPGYETIERDTAGLREELRLVMELLPPEEELSGLVLHRDGRPAAGASVRLAEASTRADEHGLYRLPLRGLRPDSVLEARGQGAAPVRLRHMGRRLEERAAPVVDIVLGEENVAVTGELVDPEGALIADWRVLVFPSAVTDPADEPESPDVPAADIRTDEAGRFAVDLPPGPYVLYALAPNSLRVARHEGLESEARRWSVRLSAAPELWPVAGHVRSDLGQGVGQGVGHVVTGARVRVGCRLDGPEGRRIVAWNDLATDRDGAFAFLADPAVALAMRVEHPELGWTAWDGDSGGGAGIEIQLQRSAFVRVAGADCESLALLDESGALLAARGPLRTSTCVPVFHGNSAVVEMPPETRWVEVHGGAGIQRLPVAPRAGEVLTLRP